jgi:hypothetical protein
MHTPATKEHQWLQKLIGTWTYTSKCETGPGQPPMVATGTEVIRPLGELWIICENTGTMPGGGSMSAQMTLGFDPAKGRFVGTWVGSPMAYMFVYEGQLTPDGRALPLDCRGPSFADPAQMADYQDVIEVTGPGTRLLRSQLKNPDGTWTPFMRAEFTRVK